MGLEAIYASQDAIPEQYRELYSERNGQFELTGVAGVKTQADIDRMRVGLDKEREEHKQTKEAFAPWRDLGRDFNDVVALLDRIPELEAAAKEGGIDEDKMNELVEGRLKTRIAPVERELGTLKQQNEALVLENTELKQKATTRQIHDSVRSALVEAKVLDVAHDDALFLAERIFEVREDDGAVVTRDNVGVTPGILAKDWLLEIQAKRPHWWPMSQGGGAGGGEGGGGMGSNPWSKDSWNLTAQGQYVKAHGIDKAREAAKRAGSSIGATHPPAK